MRRREEGLGFWLERRVAPGAARRVKLRSVLLSWLGRPGLRPATLNLSPAIETETRPFAQSFMAPAGVRDGLGSLSRRGKSRPACSAIAARRSEAESCSMPDGLPLIKAVDFGSVDEPAVKSPYLMKYGPAKSLLIWKAGREPRTRSARLLEDLPGVQDAAARSLGATTRVYTGTYRITRLSQTRRSTDLAALGEQESEKLLREAEAVRSIERGQGELLGLFPRVPVEIVSRMRFVESIGQLLYVLALRPGLSRTRVHDVIAVRNRKSGEIHLVPHRTRYRMAFLA